MSMGPQWVCRMSHGAWQVVGIGVMRYALETVRIDVEVAIHRLCRDGSQGPGRRDVERVRLIILELWVILAVVGHLDSDGVQRASSATLRSVVQGAAV